MPSPNVTTSDARLAFSAAALQAIDAADPFGFVASAGPPDRILERSQRFLIDDSDRAREFVAILSVIHLKVRSLTHSLSKVVIRWVV